MSIRARALRLLLRPTAPPLALGLVVAPLLLAAETVVVYSAHAIHRRKRLRCGLSAGRPGGLHRVGLRLGGLTTLVSAAVYVFFHRRQTGGSILAAAASDWVAVGVFLIVALSAATLAGLARLRAREADRRRREVEVSHDELGVLAEHQAALRRVATLVVRGVNPSEVFTAVSHELARCLHAVNAGLLRYEPDGSGYVVDVQYEPGITNMPVTGERIPLAGDDVGALVLRTGRAARIDSHDGVIGPEAERIRDAGIGSVVGAPIVIEGRLWGAAIIGTTKREPLPPDAEARLGDFTDLVATAITDAQTRADLRVLAGQQAALRRVATLVARGVPPSEVFSAVAGELARCLGVPPLDAVPLRGRWHRNVARGSPRASVAINANRSAVFVFGRQRRGYGLRDAPHRSYRQPRHRRGSCRRVRPAQRHPVRCWGADPRRRPTVGCSHRRLVTARAAAI